MLSEVGSFALAMAIGFSAFQFFSPLWGGIMQDQRWKRLAEVSARWQFIFVSAAFAVLIGAYIVCDFSLLNVYLNTHTQVPILYRFAGAWGNHEGSLLLWVWVLSFISLALSFSKANPSLLQGAMSVQGLLCLIFIVFLVGFADPFLKLSYPAHEGLSLNPLLQDRGLALHPPFLYLGYVGFSAVFAFAVAGLWQKKLDTEWARVVRPWALLAWSALTIGIALGSWWAYYELGWGGWWFWDPVENASLMPWLAGTALIHTLRVMEVKNQLKSWTTLLAILTFAFSLLGTFLVRSGLISSVHAFATDPHRGMVILLIIAVLTGGAFLLYAFRMPGAMSGQSPLNFISREGFMALNSVLLFLALSTVAWGTLYPLILEAFTGKTVSVGAPYFNLTVVPILFPILTLIPLGMELAWGHGNFRQAMEKSLRSFTPTFGLGIVFLYFIEPGPVVSVTTASLALWLIVSGVYYGFRHRERSHVSMLVSHIGVAVTVMGIAISTAWQGEESRILQLGESFDFEGYQIQLDDVTQGKGPNYLYEKAELSVRKNGKNVTVLAPEKRLYLPQKSIQTETAIYTNGFVNVYAILGSNQGQNKWLIRIHYHPFVSWVWWGGALMAIGGIIALRRRMRTK